MHFFSTWLSSKPQGDAASHAGTHSRLGFTSPPHACPGYRALLCYSSPVERALPKWSVMDRPGCATNTSTPDPFRRRASSLAVMMLNSCRGHALVVQQQHGGQRMRASGRARVYKRRALPRQGEHAGLILLTFDREYAHQSESFALAPLPCTRNRRMKCAEATNRVEHRLRDCQIGDALDFLHTTP